MVKKFFYFSIFFLSLISSFLFLPGEVKGATLLQKVRVNNLGLVGYWTLDGADTNWSTNKTNDLSGNGNNGTLTNMSTTTSPVPGRIGQAMKFDGSNDLILAPLVTNATQNVTVSTWVNWNGTTAGDQVVVYNGHTGSDGFGIFISDGNCGSGSTIVVHLGGVNCNATASSATLSAKTWTHIAETRDATTWTLYVNGVAQGTGATSPNTPTIATAVGASHLATNVFNGSLDDVRIYSRALSASEVKQLYLSGSAKVNSGNNLKLTSGLVGLWSFDGADINWTTNQALDRSGQGNTGAITNMSTTTSPVRGKLGQALKFDGSNDFVDTNSTSIIDTGANSVCGWVYALATNSTLISNTKLDFSIAASVTYHRLAFTSDGGANSAVSANDSILLNTWYHVCGTRNSSGTSNIYINGVLSGSADQNGGTPGSTGLTTHIGSYGNGASGFFNGSIDDVRVYNRVLGSSEIKQLYNIGNTPARVNSSQNLKLTSGLVGLWSFDGADINWTTNQALDRSGNGNTGTLTNMSTTTSPTRGRLGQALKFDGSNDLVNMGDINAFDGLTAVTTSAWVKTASTTISSVVAGKGRAFSLNAGFTSRKAQFFVYSDGEGWFNSGPSTSNIDNNAWHLLTGIYDGTFVRIYVDGVLETSNNIGSKTLGSNTLQFKVGSCVGEGSCFADGEYWPGNIDDFRIYSRALSAEEIRQLYLIGR